MAEWEEYEPLPWHIFSMPLLMDGTQSRYGDELMRRRVNESWQYRRMTMAEMWESQARSAW